MTRWLHCMAPISLVVLLVTAAPASAAVWISSGPKFLTRATSPSASVPGMSASTYSVDNTATVRRSPPKKRLTTDAKAIECIMTLVGALDSYIPEPVRETDKPFLMPVEDVFAIKGRGTVGTGRIEQGICKVGEEMEIVGFQDTRKTVVTGIEMFSIMSLLALL